MQLKKYTLKDGTILYMSDLEHKYYQMLYADYMKSMNDIFDFMMKITKREQKLKLINNGV